MTEKQIKYMVDRFLGWNLPPDFSPDNGISFDPVANKGLEWEFLRKPSGTNLLNGEQAKAMIEYLTEGLPHD